MISNRKNSSKKDEILSTFIGLNEVLADHLKHTVRNMFVRLVPFNLGYWIMSFFIDVYHKERVVTRQRDLYVDDMIAKARQNIAEGIHNTDLASILLRLTFKVMLLEMTPDWPQALTYYHHY